MSKSFSKNKKLNKTIKAINEMKNRKIRMSTKVESSSYLITTEAEVLVKMSLNNRLFRYNINGDRKELYEIYETYYFLLKLWFTFDTNRDLATDILNARLGKHVHDMFIKAKNGDEYSLSFISGAISTFYILAIYFNKKVLDKVKNDDEFILVV